MSEGLPRCMSGLAQEPVAFLPGTQARGVLDRAQRRAGDRAQRRGLAQDSGDPGVDLLGQAPASFCQTAVREVTQTVLPTGGVETLQSIGRLQEDSAQMPFDLTDRPETGDITRR